MFLSHVANLIQKRTHILVTKNGISAWLEWIDDDFCHPSCFLSNLHMCMWGVYIINRTNNNNKLLLIHAYGCHFLSPEDFLHINTNCLKEHFNYIHVAHQLNVKYMYLNVINSQSIINSQCYQCQSLLWVKYMWLHNCIAC